MAEAEPQFARCLYCDNVPASLEHPLPAAFGEFVNSPLLENRICGDCNAKRIGLLDEQFARCGPEALLRTQLGVVGREHHEKINPFYRGSAGGGRIEARAWDNNFQCYVNLEFLGGNQARQITEMIFIDEAGKDHHVALTPKMTVENLRMRVENLRLKQPFTVRTTFDPPTENWARDLIQQAWPTVTFSETVVGSSNFDGSLIAFSLTDRYFREIAKIGFHYFLTQFQQFSGHESEFAEIRKFIITDTNTTPNPAINQFLSRRTKPLIFPPYRKEGCLGHVLVAEIREGRCFAHFEPFAHRSTHMEARTVFLGYVPNEGNKIVSHIHAYYPTQDSTSLEKRGKYSGEAFEMHPRFLNMESGENVAVI
jgi:hypothetical protein